MGDFERAAGANRARKQRVRRKETRDGHRGPKWEAETGRARRSGIIRSLGGPLKSLGRKPTDGLLAPRHHAHTHPHTHTHLRDGLVKGHKHVTVGTGVCGRREYQQEKKIERLEAGLSFFSA